MLILHKKFLFSILNNIFLKHSFNHISLTRGLSKKIIRSTFLDDWIDEWISNLKINKNSRTNWKDQKIFQNFKSFKNDYYKKILLKIYNTNEYIPGLYENVLSLCDHIEEIENNSKINQNKQNQSFSKNTLIEVVKIVLQIQQKKDYQNAINKYKKLCKDVNYLFDPTICAILINCLSTTPHWKEGFKLLQVHSFMQKPSVSLISSMMLASIREEDTEAFESLVTQLDNQLPSVHFVEGMLNLNKVDQLFSLTKTYSWVFNDRMFNALILFYEKKNADVEIHKVHIKRRSCPRCKTQLPKIVGLNKNETEKLKKTFVEKVFIQKNDDYYTSNPEEVKAFKDFIDADSDFDVVIDSLNLAYALQPPHKLDHVMQNTIKYFLEKEKKILILARNHLKNSLTTCLKLDVNNVKWFFVTDRSHDDLFALYSCLHGNEHCNLVSRDLFRNYSFKLGSEVCNLFARWQEQHQIVFEGVDYKTKKPKFTTPKEHNVRIHIDKNVIHLPCKENMPEKAGTYERANFWLCIQKKHSIKT